MTHIPSQPHSQSAGPSVLPSEAATGAWGWYLYGLIRRDAAGHAGPDSVLSLSGEPVQLLEHDEIVAVVGRVPLDEWSSDALRARLHDLTWLEGAVRGHNQMVEMIHQQHTILPAKFGCVYASREDLASALTRERDALLQQLEYVTGCDEWGVRISIEQSALEAQADNDDSALQHLRQQLASATPGRAYLMKRALADALVEARERTARAIGQQVYDEFMRHARAGQLQPVEYRPVDVTSDQEQGERVEPLVRATFLVPRGEAASFLAAGDDLAARLAGLGCAYSGPWPPYTFAAPAQERLS